MAEDDDLRDPEIEWVPFFVGKDGRASERSRPAYLLTHEDTTAVVVREYRALHERLRQAGVQPKQQARLLGLYLLREAYRTDEGKVRRQAAANPDYANQLEQALHLEDHIAVELANVSVVSHEQPQTPFDTALQDIAGLVAVRRYTTRQGGQGGEGRNL